MTSIIVSPSEQRRFAEFLQERTKLLLHKQRKLVAMLQEARIVCQDRKYDAFRKKTEEAAKKLADFQRQSARYGDFLSRKAQAGERYLRGG